MTKQQWILIAGLLGLIVLLPICAREAASTDLSLSSSQIPVTPSQMTDEFLSIPMEPSYGEIQVGMGEVVTLPVINQDRLPVPPVTTRDTVTSVITTVPVFQTTPPQISVPSADLTQPITAPEQATTPAATTTVKPITAPQQTTAPQPVTTQKPVTAPRPEDGEGNVSWFDDVVFLGDSITAGLAIYAQNRGVLGNAAFIATPGYSIKDAISSLEVSSPDVYYNGTAVRPEDGIALSGKHKVVIMLGINDLCYGVDSTLTRYRQLIANIQAKNPHVTIYIQSISPITTTCSIADGNLNNDNIRRYNEKLKGICAELGLIFVDVGSIMYDDEGIAFRREFCRDPDTMGMHYTNEGYACWVDYLTACLPAMADEKNA